MTLAVGSRLGPYEIISPLGSGGMGEVYRARDTRLGREVAVKVLPDRMASDPELRARFEREAKALAAVNHPRVCPVYDLGEGQGSLYLVMELLDGVPLQYRMSRGPLPPSDAISIAQDILDALDALHRRGIVHRDVKPSNVFLTTHGTKLLDLGLALPTDTLGGADPRLTRTGMIVGTPRYMAPEQWEGEAVGPLADVFACGAILFEMLTGKPAFPGEKPMEIFDAVRRGRPPALAGVAGIEGVDRAIRKSLSRRPEDRFPSAAAMGDALRGTRIDPGASGVREVRALARLIVLPFRMARPDPDLDFLGPALAEAVSAGLTGLSGLVVRSPRLAAKLADVDDFPKLAAEADVDAALVGRLLASADRVRLTAQLVELPGGTVLAPVSAEAPRADLFELQDELTRQVIEGLRLPLTQRDRQRLESASPAVPEAYELYLKGSGLSVGVESTREMRAAREVLRRCLELDPGYAPAWAKLGRIYRLLAKYASEEPEENRRLARQAFERALALAPDLSLAHNLYTHFEIEELGSPISAVLRLLGRVEAGGADAELFAGLVAACRFAGLLEASVAAHERAQALDPNVRTSVHFTYWFLGDYQRAMAADNESVDFVRNYSLISVGRLDEALAQYRSWHSRIDTEQEHNVADLMAATIEQDKEKCRAACQTLLKSGFRDPEGLFFMARSATHAGLTDIGLDTMERIVRKGFTIPSTFDTDPWLDPLRSDPRFQKLAEEARQAHRHAVELFGRAGGPRRLGMSDTGTRRMA